MNLERDIHSLTEFKQRTPEFLRQLKATGEPVVLTINGKAELVVQDATSYQKLLELAEEARVLEGIRQGLEDLKAGRTVTLEAASGRRVEVAAVLDAFLSHLLALDDMTLDREYPARLVTLGREVRVEVPGATVTGRAVGVDPDGQLVVEVGGEQRRISAGDVIHLRPV